METVEVVRDCARVTRGGGRWSVRADNQQMASPVTDAALDTFLALEVVFDWSEGKHREAVSDDLVVSSICPQQVGDPARDLLEVVGWCTLGVSPTKAISERDDDEDDEMN